MSIFHKQITVAFMNFPRYNFSSVYLAAGTRYEPEPSPKITTRSVGVIISKAILHCMNKIKSFLSGRFSKVLSLFKNTISNMVYGAPPPRKIPDILYADYTIHGKIHVDNWYFDSRFDNNSYSLLTKKTLSLEKQIEEYMLAAGKKVKLNYGDTCGWFYEALDKYPIKDKNVIVMGSVFPWVESICLYYGCKNCTVMEYNTRNCSFPRLNYIKPYQYDGSKFDIGVSISSFEHDGLGRYGDPLNPTADIEAMKKMKSIIKENGILFLSVHSGDDRLIWNAHRVYGSIRLPLLLHGWKTLNVFGDDQTKYEPLRVLQNI